MQNLSSRHIDPKHFRHLIETGDLDFLDALELAPEVLRSMEAEEAISHKHSVERERMLDAWRRIFRK